MTTLLFSEKITPGVKTRPSKKVTTVVESSCQDILKKADEDVSILEEEPPVWHEAVLKEREKEWEQRDLVSRSFEEVFKDLTAKSRGN
ncbi:MAG: hypothetical protein ACOYK6_04015 [Chthoniobacterales bacterium]